MASSIASYYLLDDLSEQEVDCLKQIANKQTAVDKIGGIFCHICNDTLGNKKEFDEHYLKHNTSGNIVYTCVECKRQLNGYPSFRGHCYLKHIVKNKFQCKICLKTFSKQPSLTSHIAAVHEFNCNSCEAKFSNKKDLEAHKFTHKKTAKHEPPYDCYTCGKQIHSLNICEQHIDDHCEVLYPCPICTETLPNKPEATKHLTKHFDENLSTTLPKEPNQEDNTIASLGGILCCHCNILCDYKVDFDDHFALDHEDEPVVYTCNICGKEFEKYYNFRNHCYHHITKDKFQCDQCDRTFPRLSLLVIHTDAFHCSGAGNKPFRCGRCDHAVMTKNRLFEHMYREHNQLCIKCSVEGCEAKFETIKDLVVHQREHKAANRYCRQCGLQLVSLAAGDRHLEVHRSVRLACAVCGRSFQDRATLLTKHLPAHFASSLHSCQVCGRMYTARNRLLQHLRTHSDARSYRCSYCGKGFAKPYLLDSHLNIHTGLRPYECSLCPKTFTNYPNWWKHLTRVHGVDKERVREMKAEREAKLAASPAPPEPAPDPVPDDDTMHNPLTGRVASIADTVDAVIRHIDDMADLPDLADPPDPPGPASDPLDDSSDIKAIVEHIDAMTEDFEPGPGVDATLPEPSFIDDVMFADMMTVDPTEPIDAGYSLEGFACSVGCLELDTPLLHMDPLLTFTPPFSAAPPQTFREEPPLAAPAPPYTDHAWDPIPILTKVYQDESPDLGMFLANGNIF